MKILKAGSYYDVFLGEGWENHTRVQKRGKALVHISGDRFLPWQMRQLQQWI